MPTRISWTQEVWNVWTGCSHVSEGCRHCYAERLSLQRGWSKNPWTAQNIEENYVVHLDRLRKPYSWKTPRMCFVNSMSDAFMDIVSSSLIDKLFAVMNDLPQHTFQILTKRPFRAAHWHGPWSDNIWMGTSIENQKALYRLDELRSCPAKVKFISFEPLLGPIGKIDLTGYQWAIVGGESGPDYREMDHAWAREIRDQCVEQGVAFFFKQSAGYKPETDPTLKERDGSRTEWHQFPEVRREELPQVKAVQQNLFEV